VTSPFAIRGVVEGFYGRVWKRADRQSVLEFIAAHGMNFYLYAPKMDPKHRMLWRDRYTRGQLAHFGDLIRIGREGGLEFGWAVAPGLDIDYTSEDELHALMRKVDDLWEIECRAFAILWDDIPPNCGEATLSQFGSLANAQVHIVREIHHYLQTKESRFILMTCPTRYCGDPDCDELRDFGARLPPEVHILWTGTHVCSPELTGADAQAVSEVLNRQPLYWDNYPVNDMAMSAELHLEPLRGRSPGLAAHCSGLLSNPMTQPEASKIVLGTVAAYMDDPLHYDPDAAWKAAAEEVAGPDAAASLAVLLRGLSGSCVNSCPSAHLRMELGRVVSAWRLGQPANLAPVVQELTQMKDATGHILGGLQNEALAKDVRPWARRVNDWADALLKALEPLDRRATGQIPSQTDYRAMGSALRVAGHSAYHSNVRTFGEELWEIVERTAFRHLRDEWPSE
jgi:hyaluronoglucosaminidase